MKLKKMLSGVFVVLMLLAVLANTAFAAEAKSDSDALTNRIQTLYNEKNGLPTSEANTILQTSDGYLWIGGYGGLLRYDGREFRNYSAEGSGLKSSGIRALFEDESGVLWVGTNDKGTYRYENGTFIECSAADGEALNSIRCFAKGSDGILYVGTAAGLAFVGENNEITPIELPELANQTIYSLSVDANGALWGTAGDGFAFAVKEGKLVHWFTPGMLSPDENYSVLADGSTLYIGTSGETLVKLTLTDNQYTESSYKLERYSTGTLSTANALCKTEAGELWLGTNTGIGYFDSSMQLHIPENLSQNTFLTCLAVDYEGSVWAASTQGGVFQLSFGKFSAPTPATGLAGKSVNAAVRLNGLLYAASDSGLNIVDKNWTPLANALTERMKDVRIRHLFADSRGDLWLSTYSDGGLLRYTPSTEEILSVTEKDGLLSNKVRQVIELANGDIGVATTGGVNRLHDGKVIASYGQPQGLHNPMILCLLETEDGTLLAGSDGMGIYVIHPDGAISNLSTKQGLTAGVVLRMREDKKANGFWISAGSDLYFMGKSGKIREINGMHYGIGSVFDIQPMEDDVWLMKSSGLIIIPREQLLKDAKMTVTQYGQESGLAANLTANAWNFYEDGILHLCTVNGIFLLDTENIPRNSIPPKTSVSEIVVQASSGETTTYQNPAALTLPSNTKRITLKLACLSYTAAPCTVRYRMEGFDEQSIAVNADKLSDNSYTNLKGGQYRFSFSAVSADGVESQNETVVTIKKELALTEQAGFWVVLALVAALLILLVTQLVVRMKTRQMRRRQQEYKAITDQALQTIANTIDAKDKYTNGHSVRVAAYSRELARRLGYSEDEIEKVYYIALMHDIGKIGIPDSILNKPGKLTDEEFAVMRSHTEIGRDILKDFTALPYIGNGALSHHERYNGGGYPEHKHGDEIPPVARIICVADSYDAMATKRSYKEVDDTDYILAEFKKCSGTQFEPRIAKAMVELIKSGFTLPEQSQ